ncbi:MAG: hypothetical protein HP002_09505 [Lentisphaeria bacterium]|uniref:hypothetical protein n=1 Tax=Victivallis vadensis TaxID=172901 RepID=UPI001DF6F101|nr:hypothetical protein [Victivallis vadensis]MBS1453603.1 hypothetical protein [Lentisphaeria bacterium]
MEKFWMVYLENGNCPTFRHDSVESAAKEAERLTRQTGRRAFVLESKQAVELSEPPVKWTDTDKEPTPAF